jgi:uncharacterized phage-like protein YoqJ
MILSATGHRPDKLGGYSDAVAWNLRVLARNHMMIVKPRHVISGMALGWDQAWAEAALDLSIPFIAAVPFPGQQSRWPADSQRRYEKLLEAAAKVVTIAETYSAYAMQKRNEWMVDNSDLVVALWDGSSGGTGNCMAYALRKAKPTVNLWPIWSGDFEALFT